MLLSSHRLSLSAVGILLLAASACSQPANNNGSTSTGEDQGTTSVADMSPSTDQGTVTPEDQGTTPETDQGTTPETDQGTVTPEDQGMDTPDTGTEECVDTELYADNDGDGQGSGASTKTECLKPGEQPTEAGFSTQAGDCDDADPLQYEGSSGVCNDRVDDDCDAMDEMCPATQPSGTLLPNWNCEDDSPPDNVFAWAKFERGNTHINGGCFVFFASGKDTFFVQRIGLDDNAETCPNGGCICRFDGGNGYDQRLYAFTRDGDAQDCADIQLGDGDNAVSNSCRKYLYHMFNDSRGYSYAATGVDSLKERLDNFGTVEVACVKDVTFGGFPFQPLLSSSVELNDGFVMPL